MQGEMVSPSCSLEGAVPVLLPLLYTSQETSLEGV